MPTAPTPKAKRKFRVTRTETILYVADFTFDELIDAGFDLETLDSNDPNTDIQDVLASSRSNDIRDALVEATERFADVQGSDFSITEVK